MRRLPDAHCEPAYENVVYVGRLGENSVIYRLPLVFHPQPEGGFTVTSPVLPELVTEGDTLEEAFANVRDALAAVIELYEEAGPPLPPGTELPPAGQVVWTDALVEVA